MVVVVRVMRVCHRRRVQNISKIVVVSALVHQKLHVLLYNQ
jgi:hypothetical protein